MGIVGELFNEKVRKQIEYREKRLANNEFLTHTPLDLQFQNSNSWIRLASSVDLSTATEKEISKARLEEIENRVAELTSRLGVNAGADLAQKLVLYGGTQAYSPGDTAASSKFTPKVGINRTGTLINNGAYGFGGTNFGYKPMPGIQSAKISYYNNGALARADIELLCHGPEQLDLLELLYLRPGYSILLEWGHNTYLDPDGIVTQFDEASQVTKPFFDFFSDGTTTDGMASAIVSEREKHAYNYDGFYGVITNFSWTFNPDASFTVTLKTITKGSVIESLKVNTSAPITVDKTLETGTTGEEGEKEVTNAAQKIVNRAKESLLFQKLYELVEAINKKGNNVGNYNDGKLDVLYFLTKSKAIEILGSLSSNRQGPEVLKVRYRVESDENAQLGDVQYYMPFGVFLELLQNFCLLYTDKKSPLFTFNVDNTPMFTFPGQFSADPSACIVPPKSFVAGLKEVTKDGETILQLGYTPGPFYYIKGMGAAQEAIFQDADSYFCANLMEVYINFNEIVRQVEANEDDEGTVGLIALLQGLLDKVNKSLGGVNDFEVKFDEDTNQVSIYDKAASSCGGGVNVKEDEKKITKFKSYGVTSSKGSIIRQLSFSSELTNDFGSAIAIGAQANGNQIGINSTAYSEFNIGLVDRIVKIKTTTKDTAADPKKTAEERFNNALLAMQPLIAEMYAVDWKTLNSTDVANYGKLKLSSASISALLSLNSTYAKYVVGHLTVVEKAIPAPFFVPFNLQATLTGISGIKLFQKYDIEDGILPYSYRGKINFLIKNLSHTIGNNTWTTSLESLAVPSPAGSTFSYVPDLTFIPVAPVEEGETTGITTLGPSKYPIELFYVRSENPKTQIYLHHTAGGPNVQAVVNWWGKTRGDKVATHWVIGATNSEHVFEDKWYANHLGLSTAEFANNKLRYKNLNQTSLSVELTSWGSLTKQADGKYYNYVNQVVPAETVGQPVDENGKILPNGYKNKKYYQKYTQYQIDTLKAVLKAWLSGNSSDGVAGGTSYPLTGGPIPFKFNYKDLFPNNASKYTSLSKAALTGSPGVYTHNSVRLDKSDIWPQKELIDMLKALDAELSGASGDTNIYTQTATTLKELADGQTDKAEEKRMAQLITTVVVTQQDWNKLQTAYGKDKDGRSLKGMLEYEFNGWTGSPELLKELNNLFKQRGINTQFNIT